MPEERTAWCSNQECKSPLPLDHSGPCPKCGKTGKTIGIQLSVTAKGVPSISGSRIREYVRYNKLALVTLAVITLVSPLVSILLPALYGLLVSYALAGLGLIIGYRAFIRIREIERLF